MDQSNNKVKCLVWDLDNTLWEGILLEGDRVELKPFVPEILHALDRRGVLHSIASYNIPELALNRLGEFGILEYFLCPQVGYENKPQQILAISRCLGLRLKDLALIDDDPFQREQVRQVVPDVRTYPSAEYRDLTSKPEFQPTVVTPEAASRRSLYQSSLKRDQAERDFVGSRLSFLISCNLRLTIRSARVNDVERIAELVWRTSQLNATAQSYDATQVREWVRDPNRLVLVGVLSDRFGDHGTVGVVVVRKEPRPWLIEVLLVSCRALGRGVGEGLLTFVLNHARDKGEQRLLARYRRTAANRAVQLLYRSYEFYLYTVVGDDDSRVLECDLGRGLWPYPSWLAVETSL